MTVCAGLLKGRAFFMRGWTVRPHFVGEKTTFEVANFEEEPVFVHVFPCTFDAVWFFLNIADAPFIELPGSANGLR